MPRISGYTFDQPGNPGFGVLHRLDDLRLVREKDTEVPLRLGYGTSSQLPISEGAHLLTQALAVLGAL